jgi:hypothetical protein
LHGEYREKRGGGRAGGRWGRLIPRGDLESRCSSEARRKGKKGTEELKAGRQKPANCDATMTSAVRSPQSPVAPAGTTPLLHVDLCLTLLKMQAGPQGVQDSGVMTATATALPSPARICSSASHRSCLGDRPPGASAHAGELALNALGLGSRKTKPNVIRAAVPR